MRRSAALLVAVALAVVLPALPAAARDAWELLEQADEAKALPFAGEALWMTWEGGDERAELVDVAGADGWVRIEGEGVRLRLSDGAGSLTRVDEGWLLGVPDTGAPDGQRDDASAKYTAEVTGRDRILDRPCDVVELRVHGAQLRERLWLDAATGFVLRRETFDGGARVRMAGWTSLRLGEVATRAPGRARVSRTRDRLEHRSQQLLPVDDPGLDALRGADWTVPDVLPGGYAPVAAYALSVEGSVPLQLVYDDGLFSVSVFQQRGRLDEETLPPGAERAEVGWLAWEWPGSLPRRLVWEAGDTTFTLVGDAPPSEFLAIAGALPKPEAAGPVRRVVRGFGELWRRMSPWG